MLRNHSFPFLETWLWSLHTALCLLNTSVTFLLLTLTLLPPDHCRPKISLPHSALHPKKSSPTWTTFYLRIKLSARCKEAKSLPIRSLFYSLFKHFSVSEQLQTVGFSPHTATHKDLSIHLSWKQCYDTLLVQSIAKETFLIHFFISAFELMLYVSVDLLCFHLGRLHLGKGGPWQTLLKKKPGQSFSLRTQK